MIRSRVANKKSRANWDVIFKPGDAQKALIEALQKDPKVRIRVK
jgi:hypothetical protein